MFTLYTSDFQYKSELCHVQKFAWTTQPSWVEYRELIQDFVTWCDSNHLLLNTHKTREMVVDFRRPRPHPEPGMVGNSGVLAAVLTVVSVLSLSLLSFFCLRCKRKSKVIHEEHQIYNPQTLDPLPMSVYVNEDGIIDAEQTPGVYGNITTADDDDDYENSTYLQEMENQQEEEEPDYVNENGES
ncbi:hypothetical protein L3Q82_006588 [Scortum barcoo]|uniref:Uncharacterized protein n=1 Tax=Scortum barcoo TaxID=214431 RepID=A0ACB8X136_9TELE|nr:hypothetical protein L3Q82_006588 [Scortum barcoo]